MRIAIASLSVLAFAFGLSLVVTSVGFGEAEDVAPASSDAAALAADGCPADGEKKCCSEKSDCDKDKAACDREDAGCSADKECCSEKSDCDKDKAACDRDKSDCDAEKAEVAAACDAEKADCDTPAALKHVVQDINGEEVNLADYQGKALLMVNVASECGYTRQYAGLQALHERYADEGLVVMGFPCNQFGEQEPGTEEQIAAFCEAEYGVTFPMFSKIDVNGDDAAPLYSYLTCESRDIADAGEVNWNFEKFLIDREGNVVDRFRSNVEPDSDELIEAVEAALGE